MSFFSYNFVVMIMKKFIVLLLFLSCIPLKVNALSARNIIAMDMDTNRILYEKDANSEHLIASITKIMTAVVALELADTNSDVTATNTILKAFGSAIYIEVGETMKLKDLLYGLMMRSGNDAALAIAEFVGGDVDKFVLLMNQKAREIGMNNTKFINPHGLENNEGNGNTSTAYDMALLSSYAMQNNTYKEIVSTKNYVAKSDRKTYSWSNKNKMLNLYEYTTGGKTGFTEKARRTLVSTASKDNKNITVVSLNDPDDWDDHKYLYETLFREYDSVKVVDKNNFTVENETFYKNDTLYIEKDIYLMVKEKEKESISLDFRLEKLNDYKTGDIVGKVKIKLGDKMVREENIYVEKKEQEESKKQNIFQKILGWFKHD